MEDESYLYRGTTLGWPGNAVLQQMNLTPTTTNPFIATLFAIECSRHGPGIVYLASRSKCQLFEGVPNILAWLEDEVALTMTPMDFVENWAEASLNVSEARSALLEMGFAIPPVISSRTRLQQALVSAPKLETSQLRNFNQRARTR